MKLSIVTTLLLASALPALAATSLDVTPTITNSDPTQAGRLNRSNVTSTCNSDKPCPGTVDSTPRHYQTYSLFNPLNTASCANLTIATQSGPLLYAVGYLGTFDPNNLCTNYLGDPGTSQPTSPTTMLVPPHGLLVIDVHELDPGTGGTGHLFASMQAPTRANGRTYVRTSAGANFQLQTPGNFTFTQKYPLPALPDTNWHIGGVGFFGGTTGTDIAWHNVSTGRNAIWIMNGNSLVSVQNLPGISNTAIDMVGSSDFNLDGNFDVIWRNGTTGDNAIWLLNGTTISSVVNLPGVTDTNWTIVGAEDFDFDAQADIVWYNTATGNVAIWKMNGTSYVSTFNVASVPDLNWRPKAILQVSGDTTPEIIWENASSSQMAAWVMNRFAFDSAIALNTGEPQPGNAVVGPR